MIGIDVGALNRNERFDIGRSRAKSLPEKVRDDFDELGL